MGDKKEQCCIDCFFKCQKLDISSKFMDEWVVVFNRSEPGFSSSSGWVRGERSSGGGEQSHVLPRWFCRSYSPSILENINNTRLSDQESCQWESTMRHMASGSLIRQGLGKAGGKQPSRLLTDTVHAGYIGLAAVESTDRFMPCSMPCSYNWYLNWIPPVQRFSTEYMVLTDCGS